jgi:leucyl-tRNA synthetase
MAPFAPHLSEELWQLLGNKTSIHISSWPDFDEKYLQSDTMTIVVQVNGKLRSQLTMPTETDELAVIAAAKADNKVAAYLKGHDIKKTIYVASKLVSFVI